MRLRNGRTLIRRSSASEAMFSGSWRIDKNSVLRDWLSYDGGPIGNWIDSDWTLYWASDGHWCFLFSKFGLNQVVKLEVGSLDRPLDKQSIPVPMKSGYNCTWSHFIKRTCSHHEC